MGMSQREDRFSVRVLLTSLVAILLIATGCAPATPTPEPMAPTMASATPTAESAATAVPATATEAPAPTELPATATAEPSPTPLAEASPSAEAVFAPGEGLLAPEGIPRETYYAPFPLAIELDGDFGEWEGVPRVVMPPDADPSLDRPAVTFAAAADETYIYFMGDVIDNNIISGEHNEAYWNEDSIEFYVNGTGDLTLSTYVDGVAQVTIPALNVDLPPEEAVVGGVRGTTAGARIAATRTENGYAVEVAVPLKNDVWDIPLEHGGTIGFQVHLNGASALNRDTKLIWSVFDKTDQSYLNPSVFGQLIFFEVGQTEIVQVEPTPTPTLPPVEAGAAYRQADLPVADRVEDLLARMSLAEKIGQMTLVEKGSIRVDDIAPRYIGALLSGGGGYPDPNTPQSWANMVDGFQEYALESHLGIPLLYGVDAVHGHNNVFGAVIFPHNIGLGAADDPELMERIGRATAVEMIATGIYWNYAPVVAVPQDIRWGRTYEGYGQDTELVTTLATAYLRGLQGEDLASPETVLATPKHYVGDGGTVWGSSTTGDYQIDQGVTDADEATLRAVHLPPYVAAIEAGAKSIMVSFSSWGDTKMHAQRYLITEVLKGELGFEGFVVSDWGAIDQISNDYHAAVVAAINAGIDMNMVPYDYNRFITSLTRAVEDGEVPLERIDDAVRRILTVKFELGLFESPFSDESLLDQVGSDEHRALAREAVSRSVVLLKNEGGLLPIAGEAPVIVVGGVAARDIGIQCGGWTIEWQGKPGPITRGTTLLAGIEAAAPEGATVYYNRFGRLDRVPTPDGSPVEPDVCIAVVGERPYAEGVGDSADLALPDEDVTVLENMAAGCEQMAVVLISGRPLIITEWIEGWDAVVAAWLPGTEGQGVADVLFGHQPFTGRLPYTWPRSADQLPTGTLEARGEVPLFPLGYGLER
jgi:beta-glucosidase